MPAFNAYVMVDWSAASTPRLGRDSIWIATAERSSARRAGKAARRTALVNLRTRAEAAGWLEARLAALANKGRVLAGFDFPFGYPAGTAARLGLKPALLSRVGDENMGRFIREQLTREGVDTSHLVTDKERLTALVILGIRDRDTFPLIFYRENF